MKHKVRTHPCIESLPTAVTQNYILHLNGWEIKDGALGRHINSFLSLRFNSADSGSIKTFTCAAPSAAAIEFTTAPGLFKWTRGRGGRNHRLRRRSAEYLRKNPSDEISQGDKL